jgi:ABC-type proline/glycine betaine transport system substrate-binding protein
MRKLSMGFADRCDLDIAFMGGVKMRTRLSLLACCAVFAIATGSTGAYAAAPESDDPIKIILNNWSSQLVTANVVGQLLEKKGYTVEYVPSDTQLQYQALADGDAHFQIEVWEGSQATAFEAALAAGAQGLRNPRSRDARGMVVPALRQGRLPGPAGLQGAGRLRR